MHYFFHYSVASKFSQHTNKLFSEIKSQSFFRTSYNVYNHQKPEIKNFCDAANFMLRKTLSLGEHHLKSQNYTNVPEKL